MKLSEQLGMRLRTLRENNGISQRELAKRLKMPYQNVSNYERGFRQPDYETLLIFANFFEVSTDYLLYGNTSKSFLDTNKCPSMIDVEEIVNKNLILSWDGKEITTEEVEEMLSYLKARRMMKDNRKPTP
ncbi:helix-turn-helix domain-containing protein [Ammoniphilus sp. CFH 90114]|uniref:helix-turn-helix domain-containing protein n=1 Tax=Ammoniphilus sp. CFH 90114 TaxID=2493665 RepID=UPI00100EF2D1|nr:helix-turn-helix transcriptional regulator [Ammoniphilus sp. CFH 90114]RXT02765.1 XRE family transcriptional regulator [Ammoniphilus sp. CFH 90114]